MLLGLGQVLLECLLELGVGGRLGHLGQGLDELRLGAVEVLQLLHIEVAEGVELHGVLLSLHWESEYPNGVKNGRFRAATTAGALQTAKKPPGRRGGAPTSLPGGSSGQFAP
jgi:hypothetical protein